MPVCTLSSDLHRRHCLHLALGLALGTRAAPLLANEGPVWLVSADRGDAYDEAIAALRAELPTLPWRTLVPLGLSAVASGGEPPPRAIVTLGSNAYRAVLDQAATRPALASVPVVAGLLPRASFEASPSPRGGTPTTAVWLDPAVDRYLELIRRSMPDRLRVGVLFGPTSRALRAAVVKAAYDRGLELVEATVQAEELPTALAQVLREADVLLALPDAALYNAGTLNNVLMAAYRQRVPVVSYAASHVRAGATMALHVTPALAGRQLALVVRRVLADRRNLPPPSSPGDWALAVNPQVARSLGLSMGDTDALLAGLRRQEGRP